MLQHKASGTTTSIMAKSMLKTIAILGIVASCAIVSACSQTLPQQISSGRIQCPNGSVSEADLDQGDVLMSESDVVKVSPSDQDAIRSRVLRTGDITPAPHDVAVYDLRSESGKRWVITEAGGLFGRNPDKAKAYFAEHAAIDAFYYPSTRKVVVSSLIPDYEGAAPYGFLVFVRVPEETEIITYDCGSFK